MEDLVQKIKAGDTRALSKAITLAESKRQEHQQQAQQLILKLLPLTGRAKRIAISGVPGAGKSTFIESLGLNLIQKGHKVAVLAIDPSSSISGGAILGDKTRMENLSRSDHAYIRPSATGGDLGGISSRTYEALLLCEAAGFDVILVETVGVGQSETLANDITDFFLFLQVSGTGDDLQGIKRGIMEITDLIFINKTDLYQRQIITDAKVFLHRSMQFLPQKDSGWKRQILKGSGFKNIGLDEVWQRIEEFYQQTHDNGFLQQKRLQQNAKRVFTYGNESISSLFSNYVKHHPLSDKDKEALALNQISAYELSQKIIQQFLKTMH